MGQVLREDRLTATRCKLEIKRARRLYVGGRKVGRVGTKPEDIRSVWKVSKDGGKLGGLRDDSEYSGTTRNTRGRLGMLGGDSEGLGVLGIDSEGSGTLGDSVTRN